ncbi:TRAP transporter large permease subunit [Neiella marina]|uniref:TRAP transporter large permease protein n=1 Tax=Neiella holothuriorum TaxID=2870530 RepID=A0ABS7EHF7_9GAMM|nr:TRAP transporter large permease subunit [Neiella holothuriorum]MBW8191784.1 TRAP transporter large permease subunit [Neiella holothuriorum]
MADWWPIALFVCVIVVLMSGYPVAFVLAGTALIFAGLGLLFGVMDSSFIMLLPNRLYGIMINPTLMAVPLFVLMGILLEKSKLAESLLTALATVFGRFRGGMAIAVVMVGMLLAASTGIVGATVVTLGVLALPSMRKQAYDMKLATGCIAATGTLGQIIPPSIALVLLGDILSSTYQQVQLELGNFSPKTVSVGDLFAGAIIPGLLLVAAYVVYILVRGRGHQNVEAPSRDQTQPAISTREIVLALLPPLALMMLVLGSILSGLATPTEAAAVGAFGAALLALWRGNMSWYSWRACAVETLHITSMVFLILFGASLFSAVFYGLGGEDVVKQSLTQLPGGLMGATLFVMLLIFLLGFILDFIEITFVVVPIVAPVLFFMGLDPVWLGIMIAVNLQTSFLTPPFGFALFYLRGVVPSDVATTDIYWGVVPFICIQLLILVALAVWPQLATWLPSQLYG